MLPVYDYRLPWLVAALASFKPPNLDAENTVDFRQFPEFLPLENKPQFHTEPYISTVGATELVLCRWEVVVFRMVKVETKWEAVPYTGPLRLKMAVNVNAGLPTERAFMPLLELKQVGAASEGNVYGIFALVRFAEGIIITVKLPEKTASGSVEPLNFGASLIRQSHGVELPPNARMTANGVIRAMAPIEIGDEIILESDNARKAFHPVDLLDRLVVRSIWLGEFIKPSLGRVETFVKSSDGNISYHVTMGLGSYTSKEIISEEEVIERSLWKSRPTKALASRNLATTGEY